MEEKRRRYLEHNDSEINPAKQGEFVYETCREEIETIQHLKKQLTHSDIADPFGGLAMDYLRTEQEIEACLNQWLSS